MCHINSFKDILVVFRGLRFLESARLEAKIAVDIKRVFFHWNICL